MKINTFMRMTNTLAKESKCVSLQVGAMIVMDSRIISTGVNGTPSGYSNCNEVHRCRGPEHTEWSNMHEIHAEMNAILFAAKNGTAIDAATMYVTHQPCQQCLKNMAQAGINRVYYGKMYYREDQAMVSAKWEFAREIGIELNHYELEY